jgi:hypothetical protein
VPTGDYFQTAAISRMLSCESEDEVEGLIKCMLSELIDECVKYLSITLEPHYHGTSGTRLDKMRIEYCRRKVVCTIPNSHGDMTDFYMTGILPCQFVL